MNGALVAEIARQIVPVERYFAGKFRRFAEDARQQAWMVCLENVDRYDPTNPGAHVFFERIAFLEVAQQVNRWISRLSLTRQASRDGVGTQFEYGVDIDAMRFHEDSGPHQQREISDGRLDPETAAMRAEFEAQLASLRIGWQRVVSVATRHMGDEARAAGEAVYGVSAPAVTVDQAAADAGRWRDHVAVDVRAFTKAIKKHPDARQLAGRILEAEGAI